MIQIPKIERKAGFRRRTILLSLSAILMLVCSLKQQKWNIGTCIINRSNFWTVLGFSPLKRSIHQRIPPNVQSIRILSTQLSLLVRSHSKRQQYPPSASLPVRIKHLSTTSLSSMTSSLSSNETDSLESMDIDDHDHDPFMDTIFALSSGNSGGEQATAVAVIRISGPKAHFVLQRLLQAPNMTTSLPKVPKPRYSTLRKLYHPLTKTILDHALILVFEKPNSYTGQDLIEIQCHGSRAIVKQFFDVLPLLDCRIADPGEFTSRAYSNGKLDLIQVEALADVLTADTATQVQQALQQLDGQTSKTYEEWRQQLISGLAHAEAIIDFGDDEHLGNDGDDMDDLYDDDILQRQQDNIWGEVTIRMQQLQESMMQHLQDGRRGEMIREGIRIAIIGPPNAGKSSLFNILSKKDAAIVSPIAGTTRDVLQISMDLHGIKCTLQDTAGIRDETNDILELEGMKRAQRVVQDADFIVAMVDATEITNGIDIVQSVLKDCFENNEIQLKADRLLLVTNKQDLVNGEDSTQARQVDGTEGHTLKFGGGSYEISCLTQHGIDIFLKALTDKVMTQTQQQSSANEGGGCEGILITRARHRQHVENAVEALERFAMLSRQGSMAVDMAAEELRLAASELGRITGAVDVEDVLDVLFADFCIGK